jgi:hypothetical protein
VDVLLKYSTATGEKPASKVPSPILAVNNPPKSKAVAYKRLQYALPENKETQYHQSRTQSPADCGKSYPDARGEQFRADSGRYHE